MLNSDNTPGDRSGQGCRCPRKGIRQRIIDGEVVFGPFIKLPSPEIVEIVGYAGFDFVILDTEHGPLNVESVQSLVRAADVSGMASIVRVYENSPALISHSLDVGAHGIIAPHISSSQEALDLVRAARYAPDGNRGICRYVRAAGFSSIDRYTYFAKANHDTLVVAIIEGCEGISELDEILTIPGLDVVFIGPYDLSQSLGLPGEVDNDAVLGKVRQVVNKAVSRGRAVGIFVDNLEGARKWAECGVQFIAFSVDVGIIYAAMKEAVEELREIVRQE